MNSHRFRIVAPSLLVLASLMKCQSAAAQGDVEIVQNSVSQQEDPWDHKLIISGKIQNDLPVGIRAIVVRFDLYHSHSAQANPWDVNFPTKEIAPMATGEFSASFTADQIQEFEHFKTRLWQFDLGEEDPTKILQLTEKSAPCVLAAAARALAPAVRARPAMLQDLFTHASKRGRLCILEATLLEPEPAMVQFLLERLLTGERLIDKEKWELARVFSEAMQVPFPFPHAQTWDATARSQQDAQSLVEALHADAAPALIRLRVTGSVAGKHFAEITLGALHLLTLREQLKLQDLHARSALIRVYRELALAYPRDPSFRIALHQVEIQAEPVFWYGAFAFFILAPFVFMRRRTDGTNEHR